MTTKSKAKAPTDTPLCSCGCGQKTRGGTFRMGHDQRLRGFLSRGEDLKPVAAKFVSSQPKSSEWRKLQAAGHIWAEEQVRKQVARETAKAARAKTSSKKGKGLRGLKAMRQRGRKRAAAKRVESEQVRESAPVVQPRPSL